MARKIIVTAEQARLIADLKAKRNALAEATKAEKAASALVKALLPEGGDEAVLTLPDGEEVALAERKSVDKWALDPEVVKRRAPGAYREAMRNSPYLKVVIAK